MLYTVLHDLTVLSGIGLSTSHVSVHYFVAVSLSGGAFVISCLIGLHGIDLEIIFPALKKKMLNTVGDFVY